jgi:type II secretory pathway component GspD/PulD (secretin)
MGGGGGTLIPRPLFPAGGNGQGGQGQGGLNFVTRQNQIEIVQATVRAFFYANSVELSPPKSLFYNDNQGMLMVRATLQELDAVERLVASLNATTVAGTNAPAAGQTNRLPKVNPQQVEAATLVQDGRVLFEAGKLDEAEAKLKEAQKIDSGNPGADYYLNLIREIRYAKLARERELYTRWFKVDPDTFYANLLKHAGLAENSSLEEKLQAVREFFLAAGVDLQPPNTIFFSGRGGRLMVRASRRELDIVEHAVQSLSTVPQQIQIRVRFVEVSQNDNRASGIDWSLGNSLLKNGADLRENTSPSSGILPSAPDQLLTNGLRNAATASAPLAGIILTDPQFRVVLRALEQRRGAVFAEANITTLSGHQVTLQITNSSTLQTNQFESTPTLDVFPNVIADGYTINLRLTLSFAEPSNHENPAQITDPSVYSTNALPRFRGQKIVRAVNVWDGQTMVLGGLISEDVQRTKDKVPVLGDLPQLGRFFRSESSSTEKKNLMIFVTPTLIDPAGNRLHTEEEMPFTRDGVPPQPGIK